MYYDISVYKSNMLASLHESVLGLYWSGIIDKKTMNKFDKACLLPESPLERSQKTDKILSELAKKLKTSSDGILVRVDGLINEVNDMKQKLEDIRHKCQVLDKKISL